MCWGFQIYCVFFLCFFPQISFCQDPVPLTSSSQLSELAGGINISDDLKEQLIRCLGAVGNGFPSFQDCSTSQVPVPSLLATPLAASSKVADNVSKAIPEAAPEPVKKGLSVVENTKNKVTDPVKETVTNTQTEIGDAPNNVDNTIAILKGSEKEAQDLLTFRDYIQYTTSIEQNPNDPFQDLSEHFRKKKETEGSIYQSTDEADENKKALENHFRSTDLDELRNQAANINILDPEVLLIASAQYLVNT